MGCFKWFRYLSQKITKRVRGHWNSLSISNLSKISGSKRSKHSPDAHTGRWITIITPWSPNSREWTVTLQLMHCFRISMSFLIWKKNFNRQALSNKTLYFLDFREELKKNQYRRPTANWFPLTLRKTTRYNFKFRANPLYPLAIICNHQEKRFKIKKEVLHQVEI